MSFNGRTPFNIKKIVARMDKAARTLDDDIELVAALRAAVSAR